MDDKVKNDAPRLKSVPFLVLWIMGHVAAWMFAVDVHQVLMSQGLVIQSQFLLVMLMALGTGLPPALIQVLLVEWGLKKSMRGWLPVSALGWTLSGLGFYGIWANLNTLYPLMPEPI